MAAQKNRFSRPSLLKPKVMVELVRGIFRIVETEAFTPSIIIKSFAEVGLWPWNPDLIRKLCQTHCPPPSQLNTSRIERKLEGIMEDIEAEQEAERDRIIAYGKEETPASSEKCSRYSLRERKSGAPQVREVFSGHPISRRKTMSSKIQPPMKRSRTKETTP